MDSHAADSKKPFYARLQELTLNAADLYGSKAAALGALLRAGLRVPEGFALSSRLYDEFLEYNAMSYKQGQYVSQNDKISQWLRQGSFPRPISDKLKELQQVLANDDESAIFAVRSSALCEDGSVHSLAGIFESYIHLTTYGEIEQAIKDCYASLFSDRAIAMMLRQRIPLEKMRMGVILQRFTPGRPSGVTFTADTIAMDPDMLVINAVNGICAEYVNGSLPSALYHVRKSTGEVMSSRDVSSENALSTEELTALREAALRIEESVGPYQDIEWTIGQEGLAVLQARSITTFIEQDQEYVWPEMPDAERTWILDTKAPHPLKPMQQVIATEIFKCVHHGMLLTGKASGIECRPVNGHLYIHFPQKRSKRHAAYFAKLDALEAAGSNIYIDDIRPQVLTYLKILDDYVHRPLNGEELADFVETAIEYSARTQEFHALAYDGERYLPIFAAYTKEICPDITDQDLYDLLYQENPLGRERAAILGMAKLISGNPALVELFARQPYDEILYAHLENYTEGQRLVAQIAEYLKDFGLLADDNNYPPTVLLENPSGAFKKIRGFLSRDIDAMEHAREISLVRKSMVLQTLLTCLPENEHQAFRLKLRAAEKAFLTGEEHNFYIELHFMGYTRAALMKAGSYLVQKGVIADSEDIIFLWPEEIRSLLTTDDNDMRVTVRERQSLYQHQRTLAAPKTLGKAPEAGMWPYPENEQSNRGDSSEAAGTPLCITGISGCRKSVKGVVYVHTAEFQSFEMPHTGILVLTRAHGQYLLPLLGRIQGLILEYGSPFDHVGILARELNIPIIYKARDATRILQTGDEVEIDGINGQVIIHNSLSHQNPTRDNSRSSCTGRFSG
jgi:rifampicin phosphotransferase